MLDWNALGQEQFDRVTASLIRRRHTDASSITDSVIVPDARGGDQGIDMLVVDGGKQWLYQQKYFPEGFSGGYKKTRRQQIRRSFDKAMQLDPRPEVWVLVVPRNLTSDELEFVRNLPQRVSDGPIPTIEWVGQAELDDLITRYEDVEAYALRDATTLALERAGGSFPPNTIINSMEEYTRRMGDLNKASDSLDPDWAPRLVVDSTGESSLTVVPKHNNPRPIEFCLRVSADDMSSNTRKEWERVLGYGMTGEVHVQTRPGDSFYRRGPQFLVDSHDPDQEYEYRITKAAADPHPLVGQRVELRLEMPDHTFDSELLTVTAVSQGFLGLAVTLEASRFCSLEFLVPTQALPGMSERKLSLKFHLDLNNSLPQESLEALALREKFAACAKASLDLPTVIMGQTLEAITMYGPVGEVDTDDTVHERAEYRLYLEDLASIQHHTRQKFIPPTTISEYERTVVRFLRLLLEGHVVAIPQLHSISVTLDPDKLALNEGILRGEGFAALAHHETFSIQLWEREFLVPGPVITYHPAAHLEPVDTDGSRVKTDNTARVTPINGGHFVAYRPGHLQEGTAAPTPWGLHDIPEPLTYDPGTR